LDVDVAEAEKNKKRGRGKGLGLGGVNNAWDHDRRKSNTVEWGFKRGNPTGKNGVNSRKNGGIANKET